MNARYPLDPEQQLHEIEEQYESYSEMRAEFGSSYVCGGGYAHDVGAAFAQFHPRLSATGCSPTAWPQNPLPRPSPTTAPFEGSRLPDNPQPR
jgi:hypothetical protein